MVWGLSTATTSRDDTWLFMDLGRSLERADMIARLLMTRSLAGTIGANWTTLLRSCAAHEAYLRRVRSLVEEERAAEFLLIDHMFPRSIAYNLGRAERIIAELDPDAQRRSPAAQARFALGRARSDLEYRQVREILDDLPARMQDGAAGLCRGLRPHQRALLPAGRHGLDPGGGVGVSTIEIRHRTRFKYSVEIPTSYNEARVIPAHLPRQRVLTSEVEITPVTWQTNYVDYWDTRVTAFEVLRPHRSLTVTATSRVEVMPEYAPWQAPDWSELRSPSLIDHVAEYLENTPATEPDQELAEFARETAGRHEPGETARLICSFLHDDHQVRTGSHDRAHARRARLDRALRASARTSPTSPSVRCARWASRHATCPATCTPAARRPSARRCG